MVLKKLSRKDIYDILNLPKRVNETAKIERMEGFICTAGNSCVITEADNAGNADISSSGGVQIKDVRAGA